MKQLNKLKKRINIKRITSERFPKHANIRLNEMMKSMQDLKAEFNKEMNILKKT